MENMFKPAGVALSAMACYVLEVTAPMFILTSAFVIADAFTAYRLQRRLSRAGKLAEAEARFSSRRFGRVLTTLGRIVGLLLLAAMADHLVFKPMGVESVRLVAGAVCFWQALSLLENEAAENNAPWAVHARRFIIDKARRYIDEKHDF